MGRSSESGVILVDKPAGPTSHDVVALARRALRTRRIGHTGTLDPFASGLLLLCIGQATRLAEYLTAQPKTYVALVRLGAATDTDDRTGQVIATADTWKGLDVSRVLDALAAMTGPLLQQPPVYSAKKVGGVAMHRLARAGGAPTPVAVPVEIHALQLRSIDLPDLELEVVCSAGTYIRALARDLGEALGTYAHLAELRRTRIGRRRVEDAVPLEALTDEGSVQRAWLTPLSALDHLPRIDLQPDEAATLKHGRDLASRWDVPAATPLAAASEGRLLAIAEAVGPRVRPRKVFDA